MEYKNVREKVTDRLREEVLLGKYQPGESIREVPLAERYKVSRGPIRDALLQLSQEGLLECIPNRGVRVGKVWDKTLIPLMARTRFNLEIFAITELIENTPENFFTELRRNLRLFRLACEDNDMATVIQLDLEFHRSLLRESGHPGLESVWLPLVGGLRLPYSRHASLDEIYVEHKAIADAIEKHDIEAVKVALRKNIEHPFTQN